MLEVDVENFQSIEKASLRIDGYTAIQGRSNIGKSALVRAMQFALTGTLGTDFVRHGPKCARMVKNTKKCACSTRVSISSPNLKIVWEKGDEVNKYIVVRDGVKQEYSALDRGDPEFLKPEFQQVSVGGSNTLIQITESQFEPIFLLNKSGGVIADVISDVAKLDDINIAIREVNKDRKDASSTRNVRDSDVLKLQTSLDGFDGLDDVLRRAQEVEVRFAEVNKTKVTVQSMTRFIDLLRASKVIVEALLAGLKPKLPNWNVISTKAASLVEVNRFTQTTDALENRVTSLSLAVSPSLPDWDSIKDKAAKCIQLGHMSDDYDTKSSQVAALWSVDQIQVPLLPSRDAMDLKQLDNWLNRLRAIKQVMVKHDAVKTLPDLDMSKPTAISNQKDKLAWLAQTAGKYESLVNAVDQIELVICQWQVEADDAQKAKDEEIAAFGGICPTCKQEHSGELHL